MIQTIPIERSYSLSDYEKNVQLTRAVLDLRTEAAALVPRLSGRKVWMVNSAAHGGGVAEMLPKLVSLLRQVGVDCEWVVMATDQAEFFGLTKQLHNLIHGAGEPVVNGHQQQLYRRVSGALAREMLPMLAPDDILVCHDPQPAGMGALIKQQLGLPAIWRCHIGLDETTQQTEAAWQFLEPYVTAYDHAVFSAPEYLPRYLTNKVSIIHPSLDPLSFKNRELTPHMVAGVLTCAGLIEPRHPVSTPPFERKAERLQPDGSFGPADRPEEIGLLFRTIVTQISRWDRLKGWQPLLEAFTRMKRRAASGELDLTPHERRRVQLARLVLAGPEPASVADDPEATEVLGRLVERYRALDRQMQKDVVLLSLPMTSRRENHLMVNALQRCSSVVVQNSLREGFGLTVTEAMWKRIAVLGSSACGIRQQIRDGIDGRLSADPSDPAQVEAALVELLNDIEGRDAYALSAQRRVHDEFLMFAHVRRWLEVLVHTVADRPSVPVL